MTVIVMLLSTVMDIDDLQFARQAVADGTARTIREKAGYTRANIARQLNISESTIYTWERKKTPPSTHHGTLYGALLRKLDKQSKENR